MADVSHAALEADLEKEGKKEQEEHQEETQDNLTEETIKTLEDKLYLNLAEINVEAAERMAEIDTLSQGHEDELEALKHWDEALEQRGMEIAKSELAMESSRFEIESIGVGRKNLDTRKELLTQQKVGLEKRCNKLQINQNVCFEKAEEYTQLLVKVSQESSWFAKWKKGRYETKIHELAEENQEITEELAEIEKQLAEINTKLEQTENEIEAYDEQINQRTAALKEEEQKTAAKKEAHAQEKAGAAQAMPEWYLKYKEAEHTLKEIQNRKAATEQKIEGNRENVSKMRRVTLGGTKIGQEKREILISDEGEIYGNIKGVEESAETAAEEQKVEKQIRSNEFFKMVNQDTIQEFLRYNPQTGEQYGEDEEVQSDAALIRSITELNQTLNEELRPILQELLENETIAKIDGLFGSYKPLKAVLQMLLNKEGTDGLIQEVQGFITKYSSEEYRSKEPILYHIGSMIFEKLGFLLDISDKGQYTSADTVKGAAGSVATGAYGTTAGKVVSFFVGLANSKSLADLGTQMLLMAKTGMDKAKGKHVRETVKNVLTAKDAAEEAIRLGDEADRWEKTGNTQMMRILTSARRTKIQASVDSSIDSAASVGKVFAFKKGFVGSLINGGITLAAEIVKFLVGLGFEKYDKGAVLDSPQIFGGMSYNKNLVKDEKFEEILRKCTGITSKDKVYSAVKTTDSIAIHQRMMRSIAEPDYEVERLLSALGYREKQAYPNIRIVDILKKTGYKAVSGDWRQELRNVLQVEGKDYRTLGQSLKDGTVNIAKKAFNNITKKDKVNRKRNRARMLVG